MEKVTRMVWKEVFLLLSFQFLYEYRALFWVSGVTCQGNTPIQTLSPPLDQRNRESLWPKKDSQRSRHTYLHRSKGEVQPEMLPSLKLKIWIKRIQKMSLTSLKSTASTDQRGINGEQFSHFFSPRVRGDVAF